MKYILLVTCILCVQACCKKSNEESSINMSLSEDSIIIQKNIYADLIGEKEFCDRNEIEYDVYLKFSLGNPFDSSFLLTVLKYNEGFWLRFKVFAPVRSLKNTENKYHTTIKKISAEEAIYVINILDENNFWEMNPFDSNSVGVFDGAYLGISAYVKDEKCNQVKRLVERGDRITRSFKAILMKFNLDYYVKYIDGSN